MFRRTLFYVGAFIVVRVLCMLEQDNECVSVNGLWINLYLDLFVVVE